MDYLKKRICFLLVCSCLMLFASAQPGMIYKQTSPDKQTVFETGISKTGGLQYRISFKGNSVMDWSALGIISDKVTQQDKISIESKENRQVNETIPWIFGERDAIINNYNETLFTISGNNLNYNIEVRVFNGSVAFRYLQPGANTLNSFTKEQTGFALSKPSTIYQYNHESVFTPTKIDTMQKSCDFPATIKSGNLYLSIGEAVNDFFTKGELKAKPGTNTLYIDYPGDKAIAIKGKNLTPWRTVSITTSAIGLHQFSDLYYRLNPAPAAALQPSVKPGKLIRAQLTTQSGMECIDFAVKHHYQYIMFDAGWYGAEFRSSSDPTQAIPAIDMPKVIAYGKERGIGVILYVNYVGLKARLDELLPLYKKWGVAGFKFGFVDGLTQGGISWLQQAIKEVNDYGFILDIHDNYKPTGLSHTYPSLLTQEGIRGDENSPDAFHNTTLPFTRFLAGPADFTFCFPNPANSFSKNIKVSKAQQLALPVVFYSPLQSMLWYGKPLDYTNDAEIEFYDKVPTVWNESIYLAGDIGKNICVARRNKTTWYLGAIAGFEDWNANIPANFLTAGKVYTATIYEDTDNGAIDKRVMKLKKGDKINIDIKAKGGQEMVVKPVDE